MKKKCFVNGTVLFLTKEKAQKILDNYAHELYDAGFSKIAVEKIAQLQTQYKVKIEDDEIILS